MKAKANAQGAVDPQIHVRKKVAGGATGALLGAAVAGPVGAVVGGVVGTVAGALAEKSTSKSSAPVKKGGPSPNHSTVARKKNKNKTSPHVRGKRVRRRIVKV